MKRLLLTLAATLAAALALAQIPAITPGPIPWAIPDAIPGAHGKRMDVPLVWDYEPQDTTIAEGALLAFSVAAKSGGQTVTYSIGANDSGAVNAFTGAYTWTPSYVAAGTYTVTFTATAGGKTLSRAITVTVNDAGIPLAGSVTDSVWATNLTGATVMAVGVDTATVDGDGNYSLTLGDPGVYTIVATHTADYDTITVTDTTITAPVTRNILIATYGQHVKGAITENTTWSRSNNPLGWYRVDGNVAVSAGVRLTIEAGVTVKFDSAASLVASASNTARIRATGTATDSILFIPGRAAAWDGLYIGAQDTAAGDGLYYCRVTAGSRSKAGPLALYASSQATKFQNCVFSGNTNTHAVGDNVTPQNNPVIVCGGRYYNCRFSGNVTQTIPVYGGKFATVANAELWDSEISGNSGGYENIGSPSASSMTRCKIMNNSSHGADRIYGSGGSIATFVDCEFSGNSGYGVYVRNGQGGAGTGFTVRNCTMSNNTLSGLYEESYSYASWFNCLISGNGAAGATSGKTSGTAMHNALVLNNKRGCGGYIRPYNATLFGNWETSGAEQFAHASGMICYNNMIWDQDSTTTTTSADSAKTTIFYSDIWADGYQIGDPATCINSQPLFVDSARTDALGWLLRDGSPGIAAGNNYRDMGIGFGYRYPDYRSWRPCAWGQAQSHYLALPGANLDSAITYRIEGTIGTVTNPTYDAYTGLFTWTPEEGDIGTYPFVFWAKVGEDSVSKPDTLIVERGYTALSFDGGDFSRFGNRNVAHADRNALTVATWIYVDTTGSDAGVFWGKGRTADSDLEWQIRFRKSAPCSLRFVLSGDGTTEAFAGIPWTSYKSKWQHVAMTYAAGVCSVYVNGVLAATGVDATSPAWPVALYAGSGNLTVGAADYSSSTTGYNAAKGRLAMPTAYAGALTSAQIAALYAGTYAGGESMKLTRTNGTTTAGTTWYDDAGDDGLNGESGAIPGLLGHYAVWPIAGATGP